MLPSTRDDYCPVSVSTPVGIIAVTLGLSFDDYNGFVERGKVRPKFGLVWDLRGSAVKPTIRAAYFKTLKRELLAAQSLEPTSIAGFMQNVDDIALTDAEVFGLAFDFKQNVNGITGGIDAVFRGPGCCFRQ